MRARDLLVKNVVCLPRSAYVLPILTWPNIPYVCTSVAEILRHHVAWLISAILAIRTPIPVLGLSWSPIGT